MDVMRPDAPFTEGKTRTTAGNELGKVRHLKVNWKCLQQALTLLLFTKCLSELVIRRWQTEGRHMFFFFHTHRKAGHHNIYVLEKAQMINAV